MVLKLLFSNSKINDTFTVRIYYLSRIKQFNAPTQKFYIFSNQIKLETNVEPVVLHPHLHEVALEVDLPQRSLVPLLVPLLQLAQLVRGYAQHQLALLLEARHPLVVVLVRDVYLFHFVQCEKIMLKCLLRSS